MKVYNYSEARQRFAELLNAAREEEVIIKRRGGETFTIVLKKTPKSQRARGVYLRITDILEDQKIKGLNVAVLTRETMWNNITYT